MIDREIRVSIKRNNHGSIGKGSDVAVRRATFDGDRLLHAEAINFTTGYWEPLDLGCYLPETAKLPFEKVTVCMSDSQSAAWLHGHNEPKTPWQKFKARRWRLAHDYHVRILAVMAHTCLETDEGRYYMRLLHKAEDRMTRWEPKRQR